MDAIDAYAEVVNATSHIQVGLEDPWGVEAESSKGKGKNTDPRELITDIREYDVPYYLRVAIDNGTPSVLRSFTNLTSFCRRPSWVMVHRQRLPRQDRNQHY